MVQSLLPYGTEVEDLELAGQFAVDANTTTGLTLGYFGGIYISGGSRTAIADGTILLAASTTSWVLIVSAAVATETGANPSAAEVLYKITTDGSNITTIVDMRGAIVTDQTAFT